MIDFFVRWNFNRQVFFVSSLKEYLPFSPDDDLLPWA